MKLIGRTVVLAALLVVGRAFRISKATGLVGKSSRLPGKLETSLNSANDDVVDTLLTLEGIPLESLGVVNMQGDDEKYSSDAYSQEIIEDIERLSKMLGIVIKKENARVFELYEQFKALSLARANNHDPEALPKMVDISRSITADEALGTVRAFTETLNLVNAAEVYHRMRILRNSDMKAETISPLPMREDSVCGAIHQLLSDCRKEKGSEEQKKKEIYDALLKQHVDIVLTAHPTEVNRRTLLRKYRKISETLGKLDRRDLSPYERAQMEESLRREVFSIWGSDEIRRGKPTPQQEARGGNAIIETVLWDAVPTYLRKLSAQCVESLGRALPLDHVPIRFSSWMGGDRDGNPNVTPKVTYEVVTTQRMQAAKLLLNDISVLYNELPICRAFSPEMLELAAQIKNSPDLYEKYRRVLGHLKKRLVATVKWCEKELEVAAEEYVDGSHHAHKPSIIPQSFASAKLVADRSAGGAAFADDTEEDVIEPIFEAQELLKPLKVIHESLCHGGYEDVADGFLVDVIRRVATFGTTLVPLDIRQESTKHMMAIDAITRYLGLGSYGSWDETTKINFLQSELSGKRPLIDRQELDKYGFDDSTIDVLRTVEVASTLGPEALGAYVISQATSASDVLAVMLLQKQFGMTPESGKMMRVVPLFETLNDLTNAPKVVETLFSLTGYLGAVRGKQEIMVGYSDSAKDAGRLAAGWAQYVSQEQMVKVADRFNVELTFFHGKGGTVGRGGNPALFRAVLAHPPKTINGKFRVTEQGEMITQNFGSTGVAERTLDIYTAAVLAEKFVTHVDPKENWRKQMERLSEVSCEAYRKVIQDESFIRYFRTATPELELGSLNIGSRPAKRNPKGGIESLRAIPWQFAWTQTRLLLPAWLGVGEGLDCSSSPQNAEELREMYNAWPFFREMVDLIAMTLSKTDYSISTNYEMQLVPGDNTELKLLGEEIRQKLVHTRKSVLSVSGAEDLSSGFQLLRQSMKVRNPYVDPLNVLQAEMMKRLRSINGNGSGGEDASAEDVEKKHILEDTLVVSINGVAQGMKNSG